MKDAFRNPINVGTQVFYATTGGTPVYVVGVIEKLYPAKKKPGTSYNPPDRVGVKVINCSDGQALRFYKKKNPILYASSVVALSETEKYKSRSDLDLINMIESEHACQLSKQ